MFKPYLDLINAINQAHKDYVEFARSVGIKGKVSKKEFVMMFLDYYEPYLDGGKTYGKIDDQRSQ